MPYEVSFRKKVEIADPECYINECCIGGDVVSNQFLPIIKQRYEDVQDNQEDWGWFIWFKRDQIRLAVDIFCDDPHDGRFSLHLTSRSTRWLLPDVVRDTGELEELKRVIVAQLESWTAEDISVERVDTNYMPLSKGP